MAEEENKPVMGRPTDYPGDVTALKIVGMFLKECDRIEKLPTRAGLAVYFGVCKATLDNWGAKHPDFLDSLGFMNAMQEEILVNRGLKNEYNSTITKLMLSSNHGYKERTDNTSGDEPLQPVTLCFAGNPPEEVKEITETEDGSDSETAEPSSD